MTLTFGRGTRNNFISARGNLPEIISKLFQKLIAHNNYFKIAHSHYMWNTKEELKFYIYIYMYITNK